MDRNKFGSYIKESRIKKNYTQQELANMLFVDASTVSKWERWVNYPDITLVRDICRVLEISEHELIESSNDNEYRKMKKAVNNYNNMKKGAFWILNICYAIALFVCFIVNIAVNHTLSWFFIVLTSVICAYSFCPTITWMFNKNKKLIFLGSTFVSLFLLFLTCSIYTSDYWFMMATIGVFLGYFIVFYPLLFKGQRKYLNEEKYNKLPSWFWLSYVFGIFVIVGILLVAIYIYKSFNLGLGFLIEGGIFIMPILFGILNLFEVGKNFNKLILLSLLVVLILLLLASVARTLYLKNSEIIKNYNIDETYTNIKIEGDSLDVNVYLSNDKNRVVYLENKKVSVEVKVIDGILTIIQNDNRKFYDKLFNFTNYKVDLYLTNDLIDSLSIEGNTGDIEINKGFTFKDIYISNSTGDIELESYVLNNVNIKNSTGDIELKNSNVGGNVNIETKTGDIELVNVNCNKLDIKISTGDVELVNTLVNEDFNMNGITGDVELDGFDASNIYIVISTGNVKGTILSNKIFNVKSKTGSVNVPETYTGGICKITTSTGSVNISYK